MLKECLETLRFVHRLIIGVIAATCVFAISPNPKQIAYEQLEYVNLLSQVSGEYRNFWKDVEGYAKQYNDASVCMDVANKYLNEKNVTVTKTGRTAATATRSNRHNELRDLGGL